MTKTIIFCAAIAAFAGTALASERRQLDSHEHGVTSLNITLEEGVMLLEMEAPAMNIVGFEYTPSTDEEKKSVADALTKLENGADLFKPNTQAECTLVSSTAEHLVEDGHEDDHGDGHHSDHDDHDEHDDDHSDHKEATHAEFRESTVSIAHNRTNSGKCRFSSLPRFR